MLDRRVGQVVKAREVEFSVRLSEIETEDLKKIQELYNQCRSGGGGFNGRIVDIQLTSYITIHNVLAVASLETNLVKEKRAHYLTDEFSPQHAMVTVKVIIDAAKQAKPVEEKLIESEHPALTAPRPLIG